ncbi:MAG: methyltransferase domain-containing protein [Magnetococcales bacterium]|nr:methyltransferase domain-containing protein [Magnetococcales bacterium]
MGRDAMVDNRTERRWDGTARFYDLLAFGAERRWKPAKQHLFARMQPGKKILFAALGTGLDIAFFPPNQEIIAIDISSRMLERAKPRVAVYPGQMEARQMDICDLDFPDGQFDQVFTSCTFCSVPDPMRGLESLYRVLKPGGELWMFEHTGSKVWPFNWVLDMCNPICRHIGPEMNRDTVANVRRAGFRIQSVNNLFLDVVKTIGAVKSD